MALLKYKDVMASELKDNLNEYRFCFECGSTVKSSRGKCWACQSTDLREFPESMADSLELMIETIEDFNIHIGITEIID